MGRKCAVPHCYTGYRKCKEKASLYRVPDDDFFLSKWQEAIAREDRPITPKDYVCEKHFKDDDILRRRIIKDVVEEYQRPRLKPDAIPSIFPDLPEFILKMVKKRRKMPLEDLTTAETCDSWKNKSDNETAGENIIEQNFMVQEIKTESPESNETDNIVSTMCETILSNELDIKSEPEERTDNSTENDEDNENDDATFGPKMHHCDQCDYQTKYPHNLRTHKTKHLTGDEAYMHCEHCPNFKTKWELTYRNHLKIKHGLGKQEVFKCSVCSFETKVKLCLKRHTERHQRDIPPKISNDLIGSNFNETSTENSKNFKCTECFYETNSKTHIIRHIKTAHNTGDDTVVFVNKLQSNPGVKPLYKCLKCSYKSKTNRSLLKHILKHKYPKPTTDQPKSNVWKCPKCPFATFFQHALRKHQETDCGRLFVCKECKFKTNCKPDFIKHSLTHGNISLESVDQGFLGTAEQSGDGGETESRLEGTGSEMLWKNEGNKVNAVPEFVAVKTEISDVE
ncbi:RE1-silencing transcription factor B-like [Anoplophora glabripennis]|uniref:RE1-silencing transcription factor B-like n=1 Tax=Anoplophora glabripennis TaxID=217634 RepID=UPI0008746AF8|nr:RE1-silencing transcription factor B-like [Anoplophora glabripennis]